MEKIKVKNIIISRQAKSSKNYEEFIEIIKRNEINFIMVKAGDRVKIDKTSYLEILWPMQEQIRENVLNNNSIVVKYIYKEISILFTGDIEEIAEKKILEKYKNTNMLKSTILKVAHHGSKSSSIQSFLDEVNPEIALIGVGKDNNFGHPNEGVLDRLEKIGSKIYRTDTMGEISIKINSKGKIKIKVRINV